ncbi:MAG TPA: polysaccharide biosynthesis/export family protein [Opitutaceae bacterium]|nr:polysaccharide biosynthesis/export family protein [Opitutaceae bacterium]
MNSVPSSFRISRAAAALLAFLFVAATAVFASDAAVAPKFDGAKVVAYHITRGDRLAVAIFGEPDLTGGNHRVEARGTINLALIGDVRVFGLTLEDAAKTIGKAYRDGRILRHPEVTVTVEEYAPRVVNVLGKVKYPTRVDLPPEQQWTIKDVIMKCGGFDDTARGTAVRLTRTMPDGTTKTYTLDVQSAILGKDKASTSKDASFIVQPDDVIYVPEKII